MNSASTLTEQFVQSIKASLPASAKRLEFYVKEQATDEICTQMSEFCTSGGQIGTS